MAEKKRKQRTMGERWAQDKGVAFYDTRTKQWIVTSDDKRNGTRLDNNPDKDIDQIEEV